MGGRALGRGTRAEARGIDFEGIRAEILRFYEDHRKKIVLKRRDDVANRGFRLDDSWAGLVLAR